MMEEELEINRETIRGILVEDVGKWKICASFVPHCLIDERNVLTLQACEECIQSVDDDRSLACLGRERVSIPGVPSMFHKQKGKA
jgi:hypothetical protein